IADQTNGNVVDATYDAVGVPAAVASVLDCIGEQRALVSVAVYDRPMPTPLLNLVLKERCIRGTVCYTADH
ncbi:zinc-binding dehydrogenase, partial [Paraburkholderia caribensis]|nr:dehydrogenase [Paraburkholderia caribensis]